MKRIITLALFALTVSACTGIIEGTIDPEGYTRRTEAQEKTKQENAFAQSQQWLAEGERAKADQATADSAARQEEARAQADAAASQADQQRSKAFEEMGKQITASASANKDLVIISMLLLVGFAAFSLWNMQKVSTAATAINRQPQLAPPPQVILIAQSRALTPFYDGHEWLMLDVSGKVAGKAKPANRLIEG